MGGSGDALLLKYLEAGSVALAADVATTKQLSSIDEEDEAEAAAKQGGDGLPPAVPKAISAFLDAVQPTVQSRFEFLTGTVSKVVAAMDGSRGGGGGGGGDEEEVSRLRKANDTLAAQHKQALAEVLLLRDRLHSAEAEQSRAAKEAFESGASRDRMLIKLEVAKKKIEAAGAAAAEGGAEAGASSSVNGGGDGGGSSSSSSSSGGGSSSSSSGGGGAGGAGGRGGAAGGGGGGDASGPTAMVVDESGDGGGGGGGGGRPPIAPMDRQQSAASTASASSYASSAGSSAGAGGDAAGTGGAGGGEAFGLGLSEEAAQALRGELEELREAAATAEQLAAHRMEEINRLMEERTQLHARALSHESGESFEAAVRQRSVALREAEQKGRDQAGLRVAAEQRVRDAESAVASWQRRAAASAKRMEELEVSMRAAFEQQMGGARAKEHALRQEYDRVRHELARRDAEAREMEALRSREQATSAVVQRLEAELKRRAEELQKLKDGQQPSGDEGVAMLADQIDQMATEIDRGNSEKTALLGQLQQRDKQAKADAQELVLRTREVQELTAARDKALDDARQSLQLELVLIARDLIPGTRRWRSAVGLLEQVPRWPDQCLLLPSPEDRAVRAGILARGWRRRRRPRTLPLMSHGDLQALERSCHRHCFTVER